MKLGHLISIQCLLKWFQMILQLGLYVALAKTMTTEFTWESKVGLIASFLMLLLNAGSIVYGVISPISFEIKGVLYECIFSFIWTMIWTMQYIAGFYIYFSISENEREDDAKLECERRIDCSTPRSSSEHEHQLPYVFTSVMMIMQIGVTLIFIGNDVKKLIMKDHAKIESLRSLSLQTLSSSKSKDGQSSSIKKDKIAPSKNENLIIANESASLLHKYTEETDKEDETPKKGIPHKSGEASKKYDDGKEVVHDIGTKKVDKTPPRVVGYTTKSKEVVHMEN